MSGIALRRLPWRKAGVSTRTVIVMIAAGALFGVSASGPQNGATQAAGQQPTQAPAPSSPPQTPDRGNRGTRGMMIAANAPNTFTRLLAGPADFTPGGFLNKPLDQFQFNVRPTTMYYLIGEPGKSASIPAGRATGSL